MYTSALVKAEFNDGSGQWLHHFSENIGSSLLPSGGLVDDSDIVIASLLRSYFQPESFDIYLNQVMARANKNPAPSNPLTIIQPDNIAMGSYMSSSTNVSHGNTVSMFCFTESVLKDSFARQFTEMDDSQITKDLAARIMAAPIEQMPEIMRSFYTENGVPTNDMANMTVVKNPTLTITRSNLADFAVVSDQYRDVPVFFDAFDLIKERVTRQESYLNGIGYAPAVYTDNGLDGSNDTIVFTGEYALASSFPEPVLTTPT